MGEDRRMTVAEGNGPVNALDTALRQALIPVFPELEPTCASPTIRCASSRPGRAPRPVTRVMIETTGGAGETWSTVGVSTNVIDASYLALHDSLTYKLWRAGRR